MTNDPKEIARAIALKDYGTSAFHESTFNRDFNVFSTTRKMITRFLKTGVVNDKLLINNVVTVLNIFGPKNVTLIFRYLMDDVQFSVVKAILMFLKQYDFRVGQDVYPNRIIVDILKDVSIRYNLDHL